MKKRQPIHAVTIAVALCLGALALLSCIGQSEPKSHVPEARTKTYPISPELEASARLKLFGEHWPSKVFGFTEQESTLAFLKMIDRAEFKNFDPRGRKVLVDLVGELPDTKKPMTYTELANWKHAHKMVKNNLPTNYRVAKSIPEAILDKPYMRVPVGWPERPNPLVEVRDWKVTFGIQDESLSSYAPSSFESANALFVDWAYKAPSDAKRRVPPTMLAYRSSIGWVINSSGWRELASPLNFGEHGTWMFLQALEPATQIERFQTAIIADKVFWKVLFPWWDVGFYHSIDSPGSFGKIHTESSWAWSSWIDEDKDDQERLLHLYALRAGKVLPVDKLVDINGSFYSLEEAKSLLRAVKAEGYTGHLAPETLSAFRPQEVYKYIVLVYRALEEGHFSSAYPKYKPPLPSKR